jgi:hypothetical protein
MIGRPRITLTSVPASSAAGFQREHQADQAGQREGQHRHLHGDQRALQQDRQEVGGVLDELRNLCHVGLTGSTS